MRAPVCRTGCTRELLHYVRTWLSCITCCHCWGATITGVGRGLHVYRVRCCAVLLRCAVSCCCAALCRAAALWGDAKRTMCYPLLCCAALCCAVMRYELNTELTVLCSKAWCSDYQYTHCSSEHDLASASACALSMLCVCSASSHCTHHGAAIPAVDT